MKDLNNGRDLNVGRDFIINDSSQNTYKTIEQYSKEELIEEYRHRKNLLDSEIKNKKKKAFRNSLSVAITMVFIASWQFYLGHHGLAQLIIAIGSFIAPIVLYFKSLDIQTDFEIRQIKTINEINHLYREKEEF